MDQAVKELNKGKKHAYESEFHNEIISVPAMSRYLLESMPASCAKAIPEEKLKKIKNIVITGCGDSLCAAYGVKEAYEVLTRLHIDTPNCLEFSRHYDLRRLGAPGETLVILVSYSGKVSRVIEAARRANRNGAITMAVTHYVDSPVAEECQYTLEVLPDEYSLGRYPGCRTYVASTQALLMYSFYLAMLQGKASKEEIDSCRQEILHYANAWADRMDVLEDAFYELALKMRKAPYMEMLSSGPEFATAWFGQAKIYEATNDFARYENFEDWAHVDYILRKMDAAMFLFVSKDNPAFSRAQEVASVLTRQDYDYAVVTDAEASDFADETKVINVPAAKYLWMTPLLEGLAPCMFASALQDVKKTTEFCKDMIDSYFPFGGSILRNSEIRDY